MENIFRSIAAWQAAGKKTALAVVIETWGSAPRRAGSLMAIADDGRFEGSVSGGCVEGTVIAEAEALLKNGERSKRLSFTVSSEQAWGVGLACGGQIEIQLAALPAKLEEQINLFLDAIALRKAGNLMIDLSSGHLNFREDTPQESLACDTASLLLPVRPKKWLIIIGAVHIAQHLAPMAESTGYDVSVLDPRAAFTESRQFGEAELIEDWPDEYLASAKIDDRTAIVTLTHDPKIDDAALTLALTSAAFYIGCLGSKKTHAARIGRLQKAGLEPSRTDRIHGPVGLDIGAKTPAEIAISIMAEMTLALRQGAEATR